MSWWSNHPIWTNLLSSSIWEHPAAHMSSENMKATGHPCLLLWSSSLLSRGDYHHWDGGQTFRSSLTDVWSLWEWVKVLTLPAPTCEPTATHQAPNWPQKTAQNITRDRRTDQKETAPEMCRGKNHLSWIKEMMRVEETRGRWCGGGGGMCVGCGMAGLGGGGHLGTANTCLPLIPKEILAHLGGIEGGWFLFSNFKLMSRCCFAPLTISWQICNLQMIKNNNWRNCEVTLRARWIFPKWKYQKTFEVIANLCLPCCLKW